MREVIHWTWALLSIGFTVWTARDQLRRRYPDMAVVLIMPIVWPYVVANIVFFKILYALGGAWRNRK